MKIYQIVLRYLKGQKKHTIMSMLAAAVATAFMTLILSGLSVYRASEKNICEAESGTYHVVFNGLDKQQLAAIRAMDIFSESEFYSVSSYTSSTDIDFGQMTDENATIEYMLVNGIPVDDIFLRLDSDKISLLPQSMYTVIDGRLPEKDGEVVISTESAELWGYPEIGDTVDIELYSCGVKTETGGITENVPLILAETFDVKEIYVKSLTVVGYSEGYNIVDYSDTALKSYSYLTDNLVARFSDTANDFYWDMHHAFQDAGYEIDDFDYGINQQLLDYEGRGVTARFNMVLFFGVAYLVILFLMFCVRMVIDNAFEIADRERIKQFGLLKTAGASRKQIFSFVLYEAVFLAVPGVAVGLAAGLLCSSAAFGAVSAIPYLSEASTTYDLREMLEFDIRPYVYISSAVIGVFWVIISAISTGLRSIRSTPVEAVRAAGRKEKIKISKHRTGLDKGAGFTTAYASLSIKRNKKRYIITMVSLVMSIVLFTGFSYGMELAYDTLENEYNINRQPYDYTITDASFEYDGAALRAEEMQQSGLFENVQYYSEFTMFAFPEDFGFTSDYDVTSSKYVNITAVPINRETYETYIVSDISYDEFEKSGGFLICGNVYAENGELAYTAIDTVPEIMTAAPYISKTFDIFDEAQFDMIGLYSTDNRLYHSVSGSFKAIISESGYSTLMEQYGLDVYATTITYDDVSYYWYNRLILADAADGMNEDAEVYLDKHFYGSYTNNREDMSFSYAILGIVNILGYFVVAIISVIAAVNIVNIISSNVQGRTSEFAMLRACGMEDAQIHKLIFTECMIYAALACVISLLVTEGIVFVIQIPFKTHFHDLTMEDLGIVFSYIAPLKYIAIASVAAFAIAAASSWLPAKRIIKSSIVENIQAIE